MTNNGVKLERLRQNDPRMTDLYLWLSGDTNLIELTQILKSNHTVQSVGLLYTCQASWLDETPELALLTDNHYEETQSCTNRQILMSLLEALGSIPSLRKVSITGPMSRVVAFPIEGLAIILQSAIQCTKFSLGRMITTGTEADFDQLSTTLRNHPSLEEVCLSGSILFGGELGVPNAQEHLLCTLSNIPKLKAVTLNGTGLTYLPASSTSTTLSKQSLSSLCQSRTLIKLWIYDFALTDDQLDTIRHALAPKADADAISKRSSCLREIRLSSCSIGIRGLEALSKIVECTECNSLQVFHIWIKQLRLDHGFKESTKTLLNLAAALQRSRLRDFRMLTGSKNQLRMAEYHPISSRPVQAAFCEMVKRNYRLESFSMIGGDSEDWYDDEIAFYLKLNKLGRRRLFGSELDARPSTSKKRRHSMETPSTRREEWVDVLIQSRHDLNCINYFLSLNPSLCHAS